MSWEMGDFLSAFNGDRARAYQFDWIAPIKFWPIFKTILLLNGDGASTINSSSYLVKSASMPESTLETLTTYYQGTEYKAAGARRFSDWTVTFTDTPRSSLRMSFELWSYWANLVIGTGEAGALLTFLSTIPGLSAIPTGEELSALVYGTGEGYTGIDGYFMDQEIHQRDNTGDASLRCILIDSWPKTVGATSLDHSSQDVVTFDVTFSYNYHLILPALI